MQRNIKACLILLVLIFAAMPAVAEEQGFPKISYGEDKWIALHFFLQAQMYSQNNYIAGESENDAVWSKGFQLRRSRIILNGQVNKKVEFFYQTDDIFVGHQGPGSQYSTKENSTSDRDIKGIYTQDAYINYKLANEFEAAVGLICLPFMHHNRESAVSQLGVDYNSAIIPLNGTTNEWRDTGVEFRGLVSRIFDYKFGVFRGYPKDAKSASADDDAKNDNWPRFCGRIQLNFLDPETGFFYSGNYLGKKNIFSIGAGADFQRHVPGNSGGSTYFAFTGDATIDYKISDEFVIALQGAYVHVANKPESSVSTESGYFAQLGVLYMEQIQPVIKYQYWDGEITLTNGKKAKNVSYMTFGLNYFIEGNNANIKAEYQNPMGKDNKAASGEKKATLQCQIFI
jgi:hypothetical protein